MMFKSLNRRRFSNRLYKIEALESRRLLKVDAAFVNLYGTEISYVPTNDIVTDGAVAAATLGISGVSADQTTGPSGTVTVQWYQGAVVATIPIVLTPSPVNGFLLSSIPTTNITLNKKDAGTPLTSGPDRGGYVLYFSYSGDANFNPIDGSGVYQRDQTETSAFGIAGGIVHFAGEAGTLVFGQTPQNAAAGDVIKPPVTVQVLDSSGNLDTNSSAAVSLTLNPQNGASGLLHGSAAAFPVNGVATFSDLSIDQGGTYTLTASSGTDTPAISPPFNITGGKLIFLPAPQPGNAGSPLRQIRVELVDAKNRIIHNSGTVVTLLPIGVNLGAPISGNAGQLVNGVATFSNVIIKNPGFYQLQATDEPGDTAATSGKFKVAGDHLVISKPPVDSDVNTDIPLTVQIRNASNQLVTDADTSIQLTLNTISGGGTGAVLSDTTLIPFVNGVVTFTGTLGPAINEAGTYTLTATEEENSTGVFVPTNTTSPITTQQFKAGGFQLAFVPSPQNADVNSPLSFAVAIEDSHHRVKTTQESGSVTLLLNIVLGGTDATLSSFSNIGFVHGIERFSSSQSPSINAAGTYTLTALLFDSSAASATSLAFKITGDHLAFLQPITANNPDRPLEFKLAIEDSHNRIKTTENQLIPHLAPSPATGASQDAVFFSSGVVSFGSDDARFTISKPGSYTLTAEAWKSSDGQVDPTVASATSRPFKIVPEHIVFLKQPSDVTTSKPLGFEVVIKDIHGNTDTSDSPGRFPAVVLNGGDLAAMTKVPFVAGIAAFEGDGVLSSEATNSTTVSQVGTFTLTVGATADFEFPADLSSSVVTNATSRPFHVVAPHLAFLKAPTAPTEAGTFPSFEVEIRDVHNQPITTFAGQLRATVVPLRSPGGTGPITLGSAPAFAQGDAVFEGNANFSTADVPAGTYQIRIDVLGDDSIKPLISALIVVSKGL